MSMPQQADLYALVDEANVDEAYLASLSTLYDPAVVNEPKRHRYEFDVTTEGSSLEELLTVKRESSRRRHVGTHIPFLTRSRNGILDVILTAKRLRGRSGSRNYLLSVKQADILPQSFGVPASCDKLSIPAGAAILGPIWQEHMDYVFLAMCAPDAHSRVKMGVYNMLDKSYGIDLNAIGTGGWQAPLEMAATYHGNHEVARDLAFSWIDLHEHRPIDSVVHLSLDELITRVEAAPRETSIGISSQAEHVVKHGLDESNACTLEFGQRTVLNCVSPRPRYPEDDDLTREHVLATLQTPSETLLQALEAAAAPDAEWLEAEDQALDVLTAPEGGEPSGWRRLDRFEHRCFLEQHAPYHVRRLPNGGVMLATHPYRYLWPLWARALDLLGIRPQTT